MMMDHGATVKKGRVVRWLYVTTNHAPLSGFTWSVLGCQQCPVVNGTAQHVSLKENEKLVVCSDVYHAFVILLYNHSSILVMYTQIS